MAIRKASDSGITGKRYTDASAGTTKIIDVPDTPTIGTVTVSEQTASIPFTPATSGGVAATYTVISTPGSFTATGSSSPISVSGLSGLTSYTFQVRANNTSGSSAYSGASNSITTGSVYTIAQTFNASGNYTVPANGATLFAAMLVGQGVGGSAGSGGQVPGVGGSGGRSSGAVAFKGYTLTPGETFAITVGTTTSIYSNRTSTTLASTGANNASNVSGATSISAVNTVGTGGNGGYDAAGNAGNAANGGGSTLTLSEANISTITVGGPGGGGGGGATLNVNVTGSRAGGSGGAGSAGGGAGGAGSGANANSAGNAGGGRGVGATGGTGTGYGSGGGGGGSSGSNYNQYFNYGGNGGDAAPGVVVLYTKS
jgi:hypothetical protein